MTDPVLLPTDAIRRLFEEHHQAWSRANRNDPTNTVHFNNVRIEATAELQALLDALKEAKALHGDYLFQIKLLKRKNEMKDARITELETVNPMREQII